MAESIIIHFKSADYIQVADAVGELAALVGSSGAVWQYPNEGAFSITMYFYEELHEEYEASDVEQLVGRLGNLPSASLAIELRRSRGDAAVQDASRVAMQLLRVLEGVVDDTFSVIWTLEEIEQQAVKIDGQFLQCYRRHTNAGTHGG